MAYILKYVVGKDYRPLTPLETGKGSSFDIDYSKNPNVVQAVQYENELRQVFVEMYNEDGSTYDLTGANVVFEGLLPDGQHRVIDNSHVVFYTDPAYGRFRFDMPAQAFTVAGQYKQARFRIYKGYKNIATLEFKFEVLADLVISSLVPADYISPIDELIQELKSKEALAENDMSQLVDKFTTKINALLSWTDEINNVNLLEVISNKINQLKELILNDYRGDYQDHDGQDSINQDFQAKIDKLQVMLSNKQLSGVDLVDFWGENFVDVDGNLIGGSIYADPTDTTLTDELLPANSKAVGEAIHDSQYRFDKVLDKVNYKFWQSFPILYLSRVPDEMLYYDATKKTTAKGMDFNFPFFDQAGYVAKLKVQGSSSVKFPKKNYNITFDHPIKLRDNWGAHDKYTLKSNFNDASQARNVVSAQLWAGMRKGLISRNLENITFDSDVLIDDDNNQLLGCFDPQLAIGRGYGAIDGFPIGLVINGRYHGIYTLNIPKDDWMAMMGNHSKEAILSADYSGTKAEYFKSLATMTTDNSAGIADFTIEYIKDEDNADWVLPSLNNMLAKVIANYDTDQDYIDAISPYLDLDSAIDYLILNAASADTDGDGKNYLLQTWDGRKWYFAAYDKDSTFGNPYWQGNQIDAGDSKSFAAYAKNNLIFKIIVDHMRDRLIARYDELRKGILSDGNLFKIFGSFIGKIPRAAFEEESYLWPQAPFTSVHDFSQIMWWVTHHMARLDAEIETLRPKN